MVIPPGMLQHFLTAEDAALPVSQEEYLWYRWACILNLDALPELTPRVQCTYDTINSAVSFAEHARRSAVHEAAHAIVAIAFGMTVTELYLGVDNSGGCRTDSDQVMWAQKEDQLGLLQAQAAKAVAGHVVEERVWSFARIPEVGLYRSINTFLLHMQNHYSNLELVGLPVASTMTDLSDRDRLVLNTIENGELNAGLVIADEVGSVHDVAKQLLACRWFSQAELDRLNTPLVEEHSNRSS